MTDLRNGVLEYFEVEIRPLKTYKINSTEKKFLENYKDYPICYKSSEINTTCYPS